MISLPRENLSDWRSGSGIEEQKKSGREGEKQIEGK
jgi:hypothetical protein